MSCFNFHHDGPEARDLVYLALCLGIKRHGAGGNTFSDDVEDFIVCVSSWLGKFMCQHVPGVPMLSYGSHPCDEKGLVGFNGVVVQANPSVADHAMLCYAMPCQSRQAITKSSVTYIAVYVLSLV